MTITLSDMYHQYATQIHQPIPNSNYSVGEEVVWVPHGYLDATDARIFAIVKGKAKIWADNDQRVYSVPVKHIHKQKQWNQ